MEMEKVRSDLESARLKRDEMRQLMKRVHSEASTIALLAMKSGDLEEYYEGIQRALEGFCERNAEVERQVEERSKRAEEKERRLSQLQEEIDEKEKELSLVDNLLLERMTQLDVKREELGSLESLLDKRAVEFDARTEELASISKSIEECRRQHLDLVDKRVREYETKEKQLRSIKMLVEEKEKELEFIEKQCGKMQKTVEEHSVALATKKNALVSFEKSIKNASRELVVKESKLERATKGLEQWQRDISEKRQELDLVQGSSKQLSRDIEFNREEPKSTCLKEELMILEKRVDECDDGLARTRGSLNQCLSMLKDREIELNSANRLLLECCGEYDLKKTEVDALSERAVKLSVLTKDYALKKDELHSLNLDIEKKVIELQAKEKQHEAFQNSINEQLAVFDVKMQEFESLECSRKRITGELQARECELKRATECLNELEKKIESKNEELASVQGLISVLEAKNEAFQNSQMGELKTVEISLQLKEKQLNRVEKRLGEQNDQVVHREGLLRSLQNSAQECCYVISEKKKELNLIQVSIDERSKVFETMGSHLKSIKLLVEEKSRELELKEKQNSEMQKSIEEHLVALASKKEALVSFEKSVKKASRELVSKECKLESATKSLEMLQKDISEKKTRWLDKDLESKREELNSLLLKINQCNAELKAKERQQDGIQKCLDDELSPFDRKKGDSTPIEDSVRSVGRELKMRKSELENAKQQLRQLQKEAEEKKEELTSVEKSRNEISEDLVLKREELNLLRASCSQAESHFLDLKSKEKEIKCSLRSKKKEMDSLETRRKDCDEELRLKQQQCGTIQQSVVECSKELKTVKEQLKTAKESLSDCLKEVETTRMEHQQMLEASNEYRMRVDAKEKHLHSFQLSLDQCGQELELRERSFSEKFIDFKLQQQQFSLMKTSLEDRWQEEGLPPGYDAVDPPWKKRKQSFDTRADDWRPHDINIFEEELWDANVGKLDPAKVVLDLIEGSYERHVGEEDTGLSDDDFQANSILLEQLSEALPSVMPEIRARALKLARKWKLKLRENAGGPAAVLVFLHLLAAYKLTDSFDHHEIMELAESCSLINTHPGLCQLLGLAGTVASSLISPLQPHIEKRCLAPPVDEHVTFAAPK